MERHVTTIARMHFSRIEFLDAKTGGTRLAFVAS
jgi:hypothetical protein